MRIGEATAAEVRHGVGLAPDDVVEDPEAEILQDRAEAEDVVIGTDHPDRAVLAQQAATLRQPGARELVIGREIAELVPIVVDAVDQAVVRPAQLAAELQVVGRVGEDAVDRRAGQHPHQRDAVAEEHLVEGQVRRGFHGCGAS